MKNVFYRFLEVLHLEIASLRRKTCEFRQIYFLCIDRLRGYHPDIQFVLNPKIKKGHFWLAPLITVLLKRVNMF